MSYKVKRATFFILLFLFSAASFVLAQDAENQYPIVPENEVPNASTTFPVAVKYLFNLAMLVGAILVLGRIIWSGFRHMTSGNNPAVVGDAKKKIYEALLGMLILLSSYVILVTINPGLAILKIPSILPASTSTEPVIPIITSSSTFQEIPLGTIIEDLLAGNASTTAHPGMKCYKYDSEGNTVDVNNDGGVDEKDLFNYNNFYCLNLINEAFEIKVEQFIDKVERELKPLLNGCSCSSCATYRFTVFSQGCETKMPIGPCGKCSCRSYCDSHCSCCGNARGTDPGCPKNDPCPAKIRQSMDCKRQEIKQLLDGGLLEENGKPLCEASYDPQKDPKNNPKMKFLTLQEAADRAKGFHQGFSDSLNGLKEAEKMMKFPFGKRLTLQEFINLKKEKSNIEKVQFKSYNTDAIEYCKYFNCIGTEASGLCATCKLNSENRMCKVIQGKEEYKKDGDNATFYLGNKEEYRKSNIIPRETCSIDPKKEKSFQLGMIPIGETVDEAEKFANKMLLLYDYLIDNYQKTMDAISSLLNSPDRCACNRCSNESDCGPRCGGCNGDCPVPAMTSCSGCRSCRLPETQQKKDCADTTGLAWRWDTGCCGWSGYIPDMDRLKNVCPVEEVDKEMKNINNEQANMLNYYCCRYSTTTDHRIIAEIATTTSILTTQRIIKVKLLRHRGEPLVPGDPQYNTFADCVETIEPELPGYLQIIEMVYKKMEDLFNGVNLEKDDLNRCKILDKLNISRERLMKCIPGFNTPEGEKMAKTTTLSCSSAWNAVRDEAVGLVIVPSFPNPVSKSYLNCYPYNSVDLTDLQKTRCFQNMNSPECASSISLLLDNYYCCIGGN